MKFGSKDIPFVYKGDKLVYPNPIKDGLLLWYDFKGMRNTDTNKEVVKDLSGNGNDGTLTNFNFTEESGYKDNTLIFDGVDDSLTIPELVLDETAMTVVHDGKLYAYEDDKVMTVGEDGEVSSLPDNLLIDSGAKISNDEYLLAKYDLSDFIETGEEVTIIIKGKLGEDKNTIFLYNSGGSVNMAAVRRSDYLGNGFFRITFVWTNVSSTGQYEADGTSLRLYAAQSTGVSVSSIEWVKLTRGNDSNFIWYPSSADYKTTALTPSSLTELQLYNKTLRKDELLHNAESKGLKKLKPGVIVQDGLVLHYDFSNESNTSEYKGKAFDYSGNGNHGELQNFNFTGESGYDGGTLKFDGVDDKVGFPIISFSEDESWTAELSYRRDGLNLMFAFGYGAAAESMVISGSYLGYRATDSTYLRWNAPVAVTDTIEHFSVVYQSGEFSFYANGNLVHEIEHLSNAKFRFLGDSYGTTGYGFRGSINSAKVYNRPLTPEEIAHNYAIEEEKFDIIEGEM